MTLPLQPAAAMDAHTYRGTPWTAPLFEPVPLAHRFDRAAARHADTVCLVAVSEHGEEAERLTYRQLADRVEACAATLHAHGVAPGEYVAVTVANTVASVVAILAVLRLKAAVVVLDADDAEVRRTEQWELLCRWKVEPGPDGPALRTVRPRLTDLPVEVHPTALVVFTTGSTAASKPVAQSGYAVVTNVLATIRHHQMRPSDTMACALPISHVNGLHFGLFATLLSGGTCLLFQRFDPLSYLRIAARYRATLATAVPSMLQILSELRAWPSLPDLRYFVSAAAPLARATATSVACRGHRIVQGYGLSECMNFATTMPVDLNDDAYQRLTLDADIPSVGHALHGCEVGVVQPDGRPAPDGVIGEVVLRGHSLMSRYLGAPAATDAAFRDGWLHTGDLGRLDRSHGDARLLTLVGRSKNIAKCGGRSVSLEELDRWIADLPGVRGVCCIRRSDPRRGDAVTAAIERGAESQLTAAEVVAHIGRRFDPATLGLRVEFMDQIPRLRSGKPNRRALEVRYR